MGDQQNRKEMLIAASKTGSFLEAVYNAYLAEPEGRESLHLEIAALHNEGRVDVIVEFEKLSTKLSGGSDFFMTRHVFEKALPDINAPIDAVMRCVLQLQRDAGQDMAAGTIFSGYINYCGKDASRALEALKIIEAAPDQFADMLPATIVAGSRIDNPYYVAEVIRLSQHPEKTLRQRAVFSFSRVQWPKDAAVPDSALSALEASAASEVDDDIFASIVRSAFAFYRQDKSTESRVTALIGGVLPNGDQYTLHAASEILGFETKDIPSHLLDLLLTHMKRVKPTHGVTLNNIDYGIAHLLKGQGAENGLRLLEEFLLTHAGRLTIKVFHSAAGVIRQDKALLSKVMTRWLLNGARVLCESVHEIGGTHLGEDLVVDVDATELQPADATRIIFVARKAIGYFFVKPITAAGILISLMRLAADDKVIEHLGQLMFNPILLNYTGSACEYVEAQANKESGKVKETLDKALASISDYLETLREMPTLAALHPGQAHREAYRRYISESTAASMKEAEKQSVFLNLVTKSTLLYGRKSINYVHGGGGPPQRTEFPLISHSVQMEMPRMGNIDEHGLNYMLRVFRAERIRA